MNIGRESESDRIKNLVIEYAKEESHGKVFNKTGLCLIGCNVPSSPISYEEEYPKTIRKLELSTAEVIQLYDEDFNSYVMNNWKWKSSFIGSNSQFISGLGGALVVYSGSAIYISGSAF